MSIVLLWLTASVGQAQNSGFRGGVFEPPRLAPDFALQGSTGEELTLEKFRGKVVVLGFGFTSCPDVCPTTLAILAQARKQLTAAEDVQVIYITVDPQRDGPERMKTYLRGFDPSFIGGTGSVDVLAEVRRQYGVVASKKPVAGAYTVAHSSSTYLIDRQGRLRALMPYGRTAADYVHDLRLLLSE